MNSLRDINDYYGKYCPMAPSLQYRKWSFSKIKCLSIKIQDSLFTGAHPQVTLVKAIMFYGNMYYLTD